MSEQIGFRECPSILRQGIIDDWGRKVQFLDRLLQRAPLDRQHLRLSVQHGLMGFDIRAVLVLSTGKVVAKAQARDHREALDMITARLAEGIQRHQARLGHDYNYHRPRHAHPAEGFPARATG